MKTPFPLPSGLWLALVQRPQLMKSVFPSFTPQELLIHNPPSSHLPTGTALTVVTKVLEEHKSHSKTARILNFHYLKENYIP